MSYTHAKYSTSLSFEYIPFLKVFIFYLSKNNIIRENFYFYLNNQRIKSMIIRKRNKPNKTKTDVIISKINKDFRAHILINRRQSRSFYQKYFTHFKLISPIGLSKTDEKRIFSFLQYEIMHYPSKFFR